jgi:methyl-accepting chemotaxis protein
MKAFSLTAKLRMLAIAFAATMLLTSSYTAWNFYNTALDQRLSTARTVVEQSVAIARKYQAEADAGRLTIAQAQAKAIAEVMAIRYEGKEYVFIHDLHPTMVAHPIKPELNGTDLTDNKDPSGKRLFLEMVSVVRAKGSGYVDYLWPRVGSDEPVAKRSFVMGFAPWGWVLGSGLYTDAVRADALRFAAVTIGVSVVAGVLMLLLLDRIARSLRRRFEDAERALRAIASGDLSASLATGPADEIGVLLGTVIETRDGLAEVMQQVSTATSSVKLASAEIAAGNQDLSDRTERMAANLQRTASSMSELTNAIRRSSDASSDANRLSQSASTVAQRGGDVVRDVISTMQEIQQSSKRIGDITGVIDSIAFQTNILALNAAVEAARAGEQGRGFAVVASEVRTLAQRSATAAKEIKALIGTSTERIDSGTRLVHTAGQTMAEIVQSVEQVSGIVASVSTESNEQVANIDQIHAAITQLDSVTQNNAALVEQSAAAARSLKDQAVHLSGVLDRFTLPDTAGVAR